MKKQELSNAKIYNGLDDMDTTNNNNPTLRQELKGDHQKLRTEMSKFREETKDDMSKFREDMSKFREEMKDDMSKFREDMSKFREEVKDAIALSDKNMTKAISELKTELKTSTTEWKTNMRWMFGISMVILGSLAALLIQSFI